MLSRYRFTIVELAIFICVTCTGSCSWAKVDLWIWQPTPSSMRMILPRVDQESVEDSYRRYRQAMNQSAEMRELLQGPLTQPLGHTSVFPSETGKTLRTLLMANDPRDMSDKPARMKNLERLFKDEGADVYAVPLAADSGLSELQARDFRERLADFADLVIGLGGGDIDPRFYGSDNRNGLSRHLYPARDLAEARLWKVILNRGRAYVIGICRSHQMLLSLMGYDLVQDIESQLKLASHREGSHTIISEANNIYAELTEALPDGQVNTIHHQGFHRLSALGPIQVLATDANGITEMTAFKNGHGATFQFHPELMAPAVQTKFAELVYKQAMLTRTRPAAPIEVRNFESHSMECSKLFVLAN